MFESGSEKNFKKDLETLINKLRSKENFSFSKYADGELHILSNKPINNGEFWFIPEEHQEFRKEMIESFTYRNENYYVGVSCPCCIGGMSVHDWMKKNSGQKKENLTWANLFVNGNHQYYIENMVPEYAKRDVVLVSNIDSNLDNLPFPVKRHFTIGKNAWVNDHQVVEQIKQCIKDNNIVDSLFLFCAGPFGNLLAHQLFEFNDKNTYIDIGSTLNVFLLGEGGRNRGYLRKGQSYFKECVWS